MSKKKPKAKATKLVAGDKKRSNNPTGTPGQPEIDLLVTAYSEKRFAEAMVLAEAMTLSNPQYGFAWKVLGAVLKQLGRSMDALIAMQRAAKYSPNDAAVHSNLGVILKDLGRLDEATASYRRALAIKPDYADALNNMGVILNDTGKPNEAAAKFRRALVAKPDYAEAHSNLGNALQQLHQLDQAVISYRHALQLKPDLAEAHSNLGNTLHELGQLNEAVVSYRQALKINPDYAEAYSNLGVSLKHLGELNEALISFQRALAIRPEWIDALLNLASLLDLQGNSMMALNTVKQALRINETGDAKGLFANCVKHLRFSDADAETRVAMVRAVTEPWIRPIELVPASCRLIRRNPDIARCVARANATWPQTLSTPHLFGSTGLNALTSDPLLTAILRSSPVSDIEMERFLTMGRRALLNGVVETTEAVGEVKDALGFYCALAHQCFINEFVFYQTDDEVQKWNALKNSLISDLNTGTQVSALQLVALATYFPLCSLPLASRLLDTPWPQPIAALLIQQVTEPAEELNLRISIPRLTVIDDDVSLKVRDQYEESPYPRWIRAAPAGKARSVTEYLRHKFPLAALTATVDKENIDILVAGCGTGLTLIETAQQFRQANVLAIDLSLSSLCYAKRKAVEQGLRNVEYAQADILRLGTVARAFDIIESTGVLHHMADPMAGWKILLSLLRPGGVMKLGFYSRPARRDIARVKALIAEKGYAATVDGIRGCRQDLVNNEHEEDFGNTLESSDFFCTSTCRDLLFHVQERHLSLPEIDTFLRLNDLLFLGFEIDPKTIHSYRQGFPDDLPASKLSNWNEFEKENPDTFSGMYQFWVQKKV